MPTITSRLADVTGLIGKQMGLDEFEQALCLAKAELKGYDVDTDEVRIELSDTNRPDLWCSEGVARQIRAGLFGNLPDYVYEGDNCPQVEVDPHLEAIRPFVAAFIAKGPAVDARFLEQMIQTQEMLCENYGRKRRNVAMGIYDASKLDFPIRYIAVSPEDRSFVPLDFDVPMNLAEILDKHPKGQEYGHILSEHASFPLLVDSADKVLISLGVWFL